MKRILMALAVALALHTNSIAAESSFSLISTTQTEHTTLSQMLAQESTIKAQRLAAWQHRHATSTLNAKGAKLLVALVTLSLPR